MAKMRLMCAPTCRLPSYIDILYARCVGLYNSQVLAETVSIIPFRLYINLKFFVPLHRTGSSSAEFTRQNVSFKAGLITFH